MNWEAKFFRVRFNWLCFWSLFCMDSSVGFFLFSHLSPAPRIKQITVTKSSGHLTCFCCWSWAVTTEWLPRDDGRKSRYSGYRSLLTYFRSSFLSFDIKHHLDWEFLYIMFQSKLLYFMCEYLHLCKCTTCLVPSKARKRTWVLGGCGWPDMDAENWTWGLCESNKCS